jgi:hypothetical protein
MHRLTQGHFGSSPSVIARLYPLQRSTEPISPLWGDGGQFDGHANDQLYRDGILDQDRSSAYKHPFLNKRYCHSEFVFIGSSPPSYLAIATRGVDGTSGEKCESHVGSSVMLVFGTTVLIIVLAVLLIVGLFSLVRELLSGSAFAAPSSPNEENVETAEDARLPGTGKLGAALRRTACRD